MKNRLFKFWFSDNHGLIRLRTSPGRFCRPELWRKGRWHFGSSYVMDAIVGMGEDVHSCGEYADKWDDNRAAEFATKNGIDLFADNPDDQNH